MLHLTHWNSEDPARQAVEDGILEAISSRSVRRILAEVDLQPHRTRYWKTSKVDVQFKRRAEQILWCYACASKLAQQGRPVICVDEVPNFQVLNRQPIRRARPGWIEQQEFEHHRCGVVTMRFFLIVHSGEMWLTFPRQKSAAVYIEELEQFRRMHQDCRGAFLIHDGDPSHTAKKTEQYLKRTPWWRPRRTPVHASWLDQAEILIHRFGAKYFRRESWEDRKQFIDHVRSAWPEYNERYAEPVQWTWTGPKMREWYNRHGK